MVALFLSFLFLSTTVHSLRDYGLTPSTEWRNPNITRSIPDRISLASAAIDVALERADLSFFPHLDYPTIVAGMAELDQLTNQTKYRSRVRNIFSKILFHHPGFEDPEPLFALLNGYAAIHAYKAYKEPVFLGYAETALSYGLRYTLTEDQVKTGTVDFKTFKIRSKCEGNTMAGGSFWRTDSNNAQINGLSTGYVLILSALLAQETSNSTYLHAAKLSADFLHAHLTNRNGAIRDSISADYCVRSSSIIPYNSGLAIEGFAALSSLTKNTTTRSWMLGVIHASVIHGAFQGPDGIIATGSQHSGDFTLYRGLVAAYNSDESDEETREFLRQYIGVQYNALVGLARKGFSDIYGSAWTGPPSSTYSDHSQTNAIPVLIGAIYLPDVAGKSKVLRGLAIFVLFSLVVLYVIHRRKQQQKLSNHTRRRNESEALSEPLLPIHDQQTTANDSTTEEPPAHNSPTRKDKRAATALPPSENQPSGSAWASAVPTSELVQVLNERLQTEHLEDEAPPAYDALT